MISKKTKNVLLIDDCAEDRFLVRRILEKDELDVSEAKGWKDAIFYLDNNKVDLILLDLMMPEMDGISLLKLIRDKLKDVPVVIYTGSSRFTEKDCLRKGSDAMISKYVHPSILLEKIRELFELKLAA
jgi:two-component system, OmpR family, response regulator ResD